MGGGSIFRYYNPYHDEIKMKITLTDRNGNQILAMESSGFLTEKNGIEYLPKEKLPTEADVCGIEKLIGHKYPPQLRSAILKYGYIAKDSNEYLGARNGLPPEKQGLYNDLWDGLYSWGVKLDRVYFPFSANGCGDYLCVDEHDRLYEFIHDSNNHIVEFDKYYKEPDCKDFNSYLKNVILNPKRKYYGQTKTMSSESLDPNYQQQARCVDVSPEMMSVLRKNKESIRKQILEWGLKYVKWFEKGNDVLKYSFNGKSINELTDKDISDSINSNPLDLKNFKIFGATKDDIKRIPDAYFAICFEWTVDEEHGCAVVFDKNCKAFRITLYSDAFSYISDWEIKAGLALHE